MIGTGDGKQYETEFDYLIDTQWKPLEGVSKGAGSVTGAISEEGGYPSSGALSSYTLSDEEDPIKAWSQMAMMKKETFVGGRRVGEGGGGLSKPANENTESYKPVMRNSTVEQRKRNQELGIKEGYLDKDGQIKTTPYDDAVLNQSWNRLGKDLGRGDPRSSHGIPEGLSPGDVERLKFLRENILGPTPKPDLQTVNPGPAQPGGKVPGVTGYRIWDNVDKKYVSSTYKNELSQRRRARTIAEKKNLEYGAHRYSARPIFEGEE